MIQSNRKWPEFKKLLDGTEKKLRVQYETKDDMYSILAVDLPIIYDCQIFLSGREPTVWTENDISDNATWRSDFETNWKPIANTRLVQEVDLTAPKTSDGKPIFLTSLYRGDHNPVWAGAGDNVAQGTRGDGDGFFAQQEGAGSTTKTWQFIDYIYVAGGEVGCDTGDPADYVNVELVAPASPVVANGGGTGNANKVPVAPGLNIIVPAAGDGAWDVNVGEALNENLAAKPQGTPTLVTKVVPVPGIAFDEASGNDLPAGYWNWDENTGVVSPAAVPGSGMWNLFDQEIRLVRWMAKYRIWGPGGQFTRYFDAATKPKKVLPHWQFRMELVTHSVGTVTITWGLHIARVFTY